MSWFRRHALLCVVAIVGIPAVAVLLVLSRFPQYGDEAYFNYTALRQVLGKPMAWRVACDAPYWNITWAYHGPFYPLMQTVTFELLGASSFTSRVTNFLAGNAAIIVLCAFLLRRQFNLSAIALSIAWVGSRAYRETWLGRMEGIALLAMAIAFLFLIRAVSRGGRRDFAMASMALGAGAGFQPALLSVLAVVPLVIIFQRDHWFRNSISAFAGFCIPALAIAMIYWGVWCEALTQFRWTVELLNSTPAHDRLYWFNWSLGWSRVWVYGLALGILVILIPGLVVVLRRAWKERDCDLSCALVVIPSSFAISAALSRPLNAMHPYHLVLITPWAFLGLIAVANAKVPWVSKYAQFWIVALALAWIPSAAQNALMLRAPFAEFDALDPARAVRELKSSIPAGAEVDVHFDYYLPAYQAGLDFDVPWWFACRNQFDDRRWLVLPLELWNERSQDLSDRPYTIHERYGSSQWFRAQYVIVGPKRQ